MSLSNLIAKQKGQVGVAHNPTADGNSNSNSQPTGAASTSGQPESIQNPTPPAQPATATLRLGGLKLGGVRPAPQQPTVGSVIAGNAASDRSLPRVDESNVEAPSGSNAGSGLSGLKLAGESKPESLAGTDFTLDDLAATESGSAPELETKPTQFPDLVDCQAPARELPADISTDAVGFIQQVDQLYTVIYDAELFGQFFRVVMQELQEHPEYTKIMAPSDSHIMLRGLRETMGLAAIKKSEAKSKRGGSVGVSADKKGRATKGGAMDALIDASGLDFS